MHVLGSLRLIWIASTVLLGLALGFLAVPTESRAWLTEPRLSVLVATIIFLAVQAAVAGFLGWVHHRLTNLTGALARERVNLTEEIAAERARSANLRASLADFEVAVFHDVLTGAPNTRYLKHLLTNDAEWAGGKGCLILLDLRDFKTINDRYGHAVGDAYLARFAKWVRDGLPRNEHLIKFRQPGSSSLNLEFIRKSSGADEFYVLLHASVAGSLGYLVKLKDRGPRFDRLMEEDLGVREHTFSFRAGIIALQPGDTFKSATDRASETLRMTYKHDATPVYWLANEVPPGNQKDHRSLDDAIAVFGDPHADRTAPKVVGGDLSGPYSGGVRLRSFTDGCDPPCGDLGPRRPRTSAHHFCDPRRTAEEWLCCTARDSWAAGTPQPF